MADRVARKTRALLVLADSNEHATEGRMHDPQQRPRRHEDDDRREAIENHLVVEIDGADHRARDAAQSRLAASEFGPAEREKERERGECQSQQRKIDAATPQRQKADDQAEERGGRDGEQHRPYETVVEPMQLRQRRGIRGKAEEQAVSEREEPGVAEQQIEAQSHQREKCDLGAETFGHTDGAQGEGLHDERKRQDRQRPVRRHSNFSKRSPIRPRGRKSKTRIISTYIDASAAGG